MHHFHFSFYVIYFIVSNANGECKLKPGLVNGEENPTEISNEIRGRFPLIYRSNENSAKMTAEIFMDWFKSYFVAEVEAYLSSKGLPCKAILLLDSAPV